MPEKADAYQFRASEAAPKCLRGVEVAVISQSPCRAQQGIASGRPANSSDKKTKISSRSGPIWLAVGG